MGKSDRALVMGALGLAVAATSQLPDWTTWVMPTLVLLTTWTTVNRIRAGVRAATGQTGASA